MGYSITIALGLGLSLAMVGLALVRTTSRRREDIARVPARSARSFRDER
ncbi:hypothetical protein [Bosea sp. 2RAB26]